jgi:hypothetical protein
MQYTKLNETQIEELEQFIQSHQPWITRNTISNRDLVYGREVYNHIINETGPKYKMFGGSGYTTYALYKSHDQKIYIFTVEFQDLLGYTLVEDVSVFNTQ